MPSFNIVNYSLRTNKSIQRNLVFEGSRILKMRLNLRRLGYIGLGSLWFTDFLTAHKTLGVRDMYSIEGDEIGFARAKFNQPFKTVRIRQGRCSEVLPRLLADEAIRRRPWLIWLDYDQGLDDEIVDDLRQTVEEAPQNSILVVTINCGRLGKPAQRAVRLRALLGDIVPDELGITDCQDDQIAQTLLGLMTNFLTSVAASSARPGGFLPAFRIAYQDGTPMITFGGVLPAKRNVSAATEVISAKDWPGIVPEAIVVPPLTLKEAASLQAQLPSNRPITRSLIRRLGFDLEKGQVKSFEKFYRYYPFYAQISV